MKMTEENSLERLNVTMDDVNAMIKKKEEIEEQIKAYYDVLEDVSWTQSYINSLGFEFPKSIILSVFYSRGLELRVHWLTLRVTHERMWIYTKSGRRDTTYHVSIRSLKHILLSLLFCIENKYNIQQSDEDHDPV